MPVTAKLSRKFYETLGDDVTNELVDLLNQMDATYRDELREINELNYSRFEARLDHRLADFRTEFRQALSDQRSELLKWMFLFWVGTVVPLAGLMVALTRN